MIYRFGEFALDRERLELRRGEELLDLQPQVFGQNSTSLPPNTFGQTITGLILLELWARHWKNRG